MALGLSAFRSIFGRFTFNAAQQAVGFGVGTGLGAALAPEVQEILNTVWPDNPNVPASAQELATMVVQGVMAEADAAIQAAKTGFPPEVFHTLVRINGEPPGPETLLSMWDRGIIDEAAVRRGLLQSRIKPEWVDAVVATNPALLQVAELSEMVVQGVITQDEGARLAANLSYSPEQFDRLVLLAGSPPGPQEALEMWNRGILSENDVNLALLQSRLKPQWVEQFKQLRLRPLTASTAVEAALRERVPKERAAQLAAMDGMSAEAFDIALETAGRAMGTEQALILARRGEMTYDEFFQIVARSDVKTDYAPVLWKLKDALPGIMQVRQMIHANAIDDTLARELLHKEGYSDELVEATIKAGHSTKTQAGKDVSAGTIEVLYVAGIDDHPQAIASLKHLGYDDTEAEQYLQIWNARRIAAEIVHGVTMVRSRYSGWKIDAREARADLADFQLNPDTIERLIKWWTNERTANEPQLTHAAITTAFKYKRYTYDEATQKLLRQGWSADEALTLLWNTLHGDPRPSATDVVATAPVVVTPPPTTPA